MSCSCWHRGCPGSQLWYSSYQGSCHAHSSVFSCNILIKSLVLMTFPSSSRWSCLGRSFRQAVFLELPRSCEDMYSYWPACLAVLSVLSPGNHRRYKSSPAQRHLFFFYWTCSLRHTEVLSLAGLATDCSAGGVIRPTLIWSLSLAWPPDMCWATFGTWNVEVMTIRRSLGQQGLRKAHLWIQPLQHACPTIAHLVGWGLLVYVTSCTALLPQLMQTQKGVSSPYQPAPGLLSLHSTSCSPLHGHLQGFSSEPFYQPTAKLPEVSLLCWVVPCKSPRLPLKEATSISIVDWNPRLRLLGVVAPLLVTQSGCRHPCLQQTALKLVMLETAAESTSGTAGAFETPEGLSGTS